MPYTIYDVNTAPAAARDILAAAGRTYGFVPNLLGCMADAPALLKAYATLSRLFDETSFSATERQLVLLTPAPLEIKALFAAGGYGPQQALEVVPGVGMKTLSNYTNHLAGTPLDEAFTGSAWTTAA
ncbi:MAG: hypothetical protein HYY76_16890 [Acidobacteria bacterium]|nr:hypothetical protein [Acidobacteriota bacterium]